MTRERETRDVEVFVETLRAAGGTGAEDLFDREAPVYVARAPGRLDVMGGIADYSGSLVLEKTIAEATCVALQRCDSPVLRIVSRSPADSGRQLDIDLSVLESEGHPLAYTDARRLFEQDHWASYVAGVFLVLMHERGVRLEGGASLLVSSTVPEGKGVASSAALEVAVMEAASAALGLGLGPGEKAVMCQKAENLVAGAPCGVMDQMASACGEANSLLALLCQPAELEPPVKVPEGLEFWGLDSGERHEITGSDYTSVRAGAFMGHRLLGLAGDEYLANIPPETFERECARRLPDSMSGEEFLSLHSGTADFLTRVDPSRIYRVREPTAHPVYENARVRAFRQLLESDTDEAQRVQLGELMYASHASYSRCGLGSPGTDRLVDLVRSAGPQAGLYGARITGGGSGGTVAVLGRAQEAGAAIDRIVARYAAATGYHAYVFKGSSTGAAGFGPMVVNL